jgi:hypothetical protein
LTRKFLCEICIILRICFTCKQFSLFYVFFSVFPCLTKAKRVLSGVYIGMRENRELAENVWYEVETAVNVGEPLFRLWVGVMPGSRLALFLRPHRGAGFGATPSLVRARVLGGFALGTFLRPHRGAVGLSNALNVSGADVGWGVLLGSRLALCLRPHRGAEG